MFSVLNNYSHAASASKDHFCESNLIIHISLLSYLFSLESEWGEEGIQIKLALISHIKKALIADILVNAMKEFISLFFMRSVIEEIWDEGNNYN